MKILCATDFSPFSARAVVVAARVARRLGDDLLLAHALEYPPRGLLAGDVPLPEDFYVSLEAAARQELARIAAGLTAEGLRVDTEVIDGYAPEAILAAARKSGARMIVLGSHGRSRGGRILAGSVADEVAGSSDRPVLVVRGEAPSLGADVAPVGLKVLCALDMSHASDAAVEVLHELRRRGPVDVVVAHCYWAPGEYRRLGLFGPRTLNESDPEVAEVIERELRAKLGDLPGEGRVTFRIAPSLGRPADPLARWAEEEGADLILLGTHGRHGFARLWHGSVARDVLHVSKVPVLCAPSKAEPPSTEPEVPVLQKVLAATDLSPLGNAAVRQAVGLVQPGGHVQVVHVHERKPASPSYAYESPQPPLSAAERGDLERKLRAAVPRSADARGVSVQIEIVEAGRSADGILAAVERAGADALVIGTHGVTGLRGALLGSVAEAVVRQAHVPVMLVRPKLA